MDGDDHPPQDKKEPTSTIISYTNLQSFLLVTIVSLTSLQFSLWLPFVLPLGVANASSKTYLPAYYHYDAINTKFDNTIWTFGTDYLLTLIMFTIAYYCYYHGRRSSSIGSGSGDETISSSSSYKLQFYTTGLLICYGLSTLAGGYSHQYYNGVTALNTQNFRILWTITVGNVAFASCFMGLIGREVHLLFATTTTTSSSNRGAALSQRLLPIGPIWFWPVYGTFMLLACAMGCMSYKRPACDIFIAGITQFPTTAYCLLVMGLCTTTTTTTTSSKEEGDSSSPIDHVRLPFRIMFYIGFAGNAPLLPMYPILVQHTTLSLAAINTLLHTNLLCMWGMQGLSVLHLIKAIGLHEKKKKLSIMTTKKLE